MRNLLVSDRLGLEYSGNSKSSTSKKGYSEVDTQNIPSATNSLSTKKDQSVCIFCDVSEPESENRSRPLKMTYEKRKEFVKSKRGCLICLKIGHVYWKCKNKKLNCEFCSRYHVSFMCSVEHKNKESEKSSTSKNCAQMRNEAN